MQLAMVFAAFWVLGLPTIFASASAQQALAPPLEASIAARASANTSCTVGITTPVCRGSGSDRACYYCTADNSTLAIDNNADTVWVSPPEQSAWIALDLDLSGTKQVSSVTIDFGGVFPAAFVIQRMAPGAAQWEPWAYFSEDCVADFGLPPNGVPSGATDPVCSRILQRGGSGAVQRISTFIVLGPERIPDIRSPGTSATLQQFSLATAVRILLVRYAESAVAYDYFGTSFSISNFPFFVIHDVAIEGRCFCNGHARSCSGDGACDCEHNTAGATCDTCLDDFNAAPWRAGSLPLVLSDTVGPANACVACNCSGAAAQCAYSAERELATGDGSDCRLHCTSSRTGYNCENCLTGFFHAGDTCEECSCDPRGVLPHICSDDGTCECKSNVARGGRCDHCARGYRGLNESDPDGCFPCNCYGPGTRGHEEDCDENLGCDCEPAYTGERCEECAPESYARVDATGMHQCVPCHSECSGGCSTYGNTLGVCQRCRHDALNNGSHTICVSSCANLMEIYPHTYFTRSASECGVCDAQCSGGCYGPGPTMCNGCTNFEHDGTCVTECPRLTTPWPLNSNICHRCHEHCDVGCDGPGPSDCHRCTNFTSEPSGVCVAECDSAIEYISTTDEDNLRCREDVDSCVCRPCDENCNTCSGPGPTNCLTCAENAYEYSGGSVGSSFECVPSCNLSTAFINASAGRRRCIDCHSECAPMGCQGATNLDCNACSSWQEDWSSRCVDSCPADSYYISSTKRCYQECPSGMFPSVRECRNCSLGCAECTVNYDCDRCSSGFLLQPDADNFRTCVSECDTQYFLQEDDGGAICIPCDTECNGCVGIGPQNCSSCRNFEVRLSGECVPECPEGHFMQQRSEGANTCERCDSQCANGCNGPTAHSCLPRANGTHGCVTVEQDGLCVDACDSARYLQGTVCSRCHSLCTQCNGPTNGDCLECTTGYFLLNGQCLQCHSECGGNGSCIGTSATDCLDGCRHFRTESVGTTGSVSTCIFSCPDNYYISDALDSVCEECHQECYGGCTGPEASQCAQCRSVLHENQCVESCPTGYISVQYGDQYICTSCNGQCSGGCTGLSARDCVSCTNFRHDGNCVQNCPENTYSSGSDCLACSVQCTQGCSGSSSSNCTACRHASYAGRCVESCPESSFFEPEQRTCNNCHRECLSGCNGPSSWDCDRCRNYNINGMCVEACPVGYFTDEVGRTCQRCNSECQGGCSGPAPTDCHAYANYIETTAQGVVMCVSRCSDSKFVTSGNTCVSTCPESEPYYMDPRATSGIARCGESCASLGDARFLFTSRYDPLRCTTEDVAEADESAREGLDDEKAIPAVAIGVAAFILLAAVAIVVLYVQRRKMSDALDRNHETAVSPPPLSPSLRSVSPIRGDFSPSPTQSRTLTITNPYLDVVPGDTTLDESMNVSTYL